MEYLTEIKVRGYHADFYGHVNNARYLEFFEEDRWAHLDTSLDLQEWASRGLIFLVVNINVNYRKAVGVGETLLISTEIEKVGNKSGVLLQKIVLKATGEVAADALITFVISDRSGRAVVLEGEVLRQIQRIAPKA
jgi:thioesterase III